MNCQSLNPSWFRLFSRPDPRNTPRYDYTGNREITLTYKLESGRKLVRTYIVPEKGFEPEMKSVM